MKNRTHLIIGKRILFVFIFGIALAADLVSKWAAFRFTAWGERYSLIGGFLDFQKAKNFGGIFGLPVPPAITVIMSGIAAVFIVGYLLNSRGRLPFTQIYLGLILSGVMGNLYDRLVFGYVRDFVLLYAGEFHWPNWNLADAFLLIGVAFAMVQFIFMDKESEADLKSNASSA